MRLCGLEPMILKTLTQASSRRLSLRLNFRHISEH